MHNDLRERGPQILNGLKEDLEPLAALREAEEWGAEWAEQTGMTLASTSSDRAREYARGQVRLQNRNFHDPYGSTASVIGTEVDETIYTHALRLWHLENQPTTPNPMRSKSGPRPKNDGQSLKFAQGLWQRHEVDSKSEAARRAVKKYGRGDRASDKAAFHAIRRQLD